MAGGPQQLRQIGKAIRIYQNSNDKVLGIDSISIVADTKKVADGVWHRSAYKQSKRCLFNLETGNRTVSTVQMAGNYSSITEDSGDYLTATWEDVTGDANDVEISFADLAKVGDAL